MDPVFKMPASPGTPLFPVSPERANRQTLPHSPSLPSDLYDPFKVASTRENLRVQDKVAQFNNLSKEAVQRRKDNEAAMRRAVLGREEAENESRRLRDENQALRRNLEEGRAREKRVAERLESVMVRLLRLTNSASMSDSLQEELHNSKQTEEHAQVVYAKEVRRARKEAFKSSSALVQLQEELKTTRNRYTLMREEVEAQKRRVENKDQEASAAQYQLVALQEELESMKRTVKVVEEERDAVKANLKQEEISRIAAEGKIALPPAEEFDEFASPKKRRRESIKENVDSKVIEEGEGNNQRTLEELEALEQELRHEKKLRTRAVDLIDFMKMECQFQCCSCRIAEQQGTHYIHDKSYQEKANTKAITKPNDTPAALPPAIPPPAPSEPSPSSESSPSSPAKASSPLGHTTEMLINFSPSTETFYKAPTPIKSDLPELPLLPRPSKLRPKTAREETPRHVSTPMIHQPSPRRPHQQAQVLAPQTPRPLPTLPQQAPHTTHPSIRSVTFPGTTTITTTVPLAPIPVSPDKTISRDEALEQIRQRRGRARSAAANGTPRKVVIGAREGRDLSAPARQWVNTESQKE